MHGEPVHTWTIPFSKVWPNPPHLREKVDDARVCFFSGHLFPDGSLLVVLQGIQNSMNGYGLVKLDKDSNVIWKHADNCHHDLDVGEDGTIYAIKHVSAHVLPEGLDFLNSPALLDSLVVLKPDQAEQPKPISIIEAFRDSAKYKTLLGDLEPRKGHMGQPPPTFGGVMLDMRQRDPLHMNFVQVLTPRLAPKFKQLGFKAGQVLISMRHLDAIAVIDPETRSLVWAARGPGAASTMPSSWTMAISYSSTTWAGPGGPECSSTIRSTSRSPGRTPGRTGGFSSPSNAACASACPTTTP